MAHENLFATIAGAKPPSNFSNRLGIGEHEVILKRYGVKPSQKNQNKLIIEADFVVERSTVHKVGDTHGWAWFPNTDQYGYAEGRAKEFLRAVADSIGDQRDLTAVGTDLVHPNQPGRGIVVGVIVTGVFNADGSPRRDKNGNQITNAEWRAIPQGGEQIAQVRAALDQKEPGGGAPQPQPQAPAPQTQTQWQQPAPQVSPQQWGQQPAGYQAPAPAQQAPAGFGNSTIAQQAPPQTQTAAPAQGGGVLASLRR